MSLHILRKQRNKVDRNDLQKVLHIYCLAGKLLNAMRSM